MRTGLMLFCVLTLFAQDPKADTQNLLTLTESLRTAMDAGDWKRAGELSSALKKSVTTVRDIALAKSSTEQIDRVLGWLPENTETIIVAQQPFTISEIDPNSAQDALTVARGYVAGLLGETEGEQLWHALYGSTVRFGLLAARKFTNRPAESNGKSPLGMIAYQGCGVYAFGTAVQEGAIKRPPDIAVGGRQIWTYSSKESGDTYLIFLEPDLILACNDKDFLSSILSRMDDSSKQKRFQSLPEWGQVDRSAPFWGLRHFIPEAKNWDPTHPANGGVSGQPDLGAIGTIIQVGRPAGKVYARWLSTSPDNPWEGIDKTPDFKGVAITRKISDDVWEFSADDDASSGAFAVFALMAMLGFAIAL